MVPIPVIALIGWNKQRHWSMNMMEESTEKNCYSTVAPVYPKLPMHYIKELQINKLKMQYYATMPTLELFHNAPMLTKSCTKSLMLHYYGDHISKSYISQLYTICTTPFHFKFFNSIPFYKKGNPIRQHN